MSTVKKQFEWIFGDGTADSLDSALKAIKDHGGDALEIKIENLAEKYEWKIDKLVSHGTNILNPPETLNAATETRKEATALAIDGSGVGSAGLVVLTRKTDDFSIAIWGSNMDLGTPQYQVRFGHKLAADYDLISYMDDRMPRVTATGNPLSLKSAEGVRLFASMATNPEDDNLSILTVVLRDIEPKISRIQSAQHYKSMRVESIENNALIYCKAPGEKLEFVFEGDRDACNFRVKGHNLWLNYRNKTGAIKLYDDGNTDMNNLPVQGLWKPTAVKTKSYEYWTLRGFGTGSSFYPSDQYMWLDEDEPYVTHSGDKDNIDSHWKISLSKELMS